DRPEAVDISVVCCLDDASLLQHTRPMDPARFHDFEHAGWQRAAEHYVSTFGAVTAQTIAALLNAVRVAPGTRLLDVATGPGHVAAAAADQGADAVGLDFSAAMIAEARRRYPALTFV